MPMDQSDYLILCKCIIKFNNPRLLLIILNLHLNNSNLET